MEGRKGDRNDRLVGFLGLCRRAGAVTPGFDAAMEKVKAGAARSWSAGSDCSPKTKKEAEYFCGRRVPVLTLPVEMDSMVHIFKNGWRSWPFQIQISLRN